MHINWAPENSKLMSIFWMLLKKHLANTELYQKKYILPSSWAIQKFVLSTKLKKVLCCNIENFSKKYIFIAARQNMARTLCVQDDTNKNLGNNASSPKLLENKPQHKMSVFYFAFAFRYIYSAISTKWFINGVYNWYLMLAKLKEREFWEFYSFSICTTISQLLHYESACSDLFKSRTRYFRKCFWESLETQTKFRCKKFLYVWLFSFM